MASTCYDYPSAPHGTPAFYVPDVVVHPPVEEQTSVCMPYMVFDAATAVPNPGPCTPELSAVASRLETWQHDVDAYTDASSTSRCAYSSRRASIHRSTPLGFVSSDLYRCQASSPELSPTGTVDSLDVVEVVKVPRTRNGNAYGEQTADKQPKRGGLGARLRSSLRVVSSGSRKSPYEKPSAVEYARPTQPKENTPPLPPRKLVMPPPVESERSKAGKASLQRGRSTRLGLSQLFTFGSAQSVPDAATTGAAAPPPGRHSMSASSTLTVSSGSTKVSDAQTLRPSLDETSVPGSTSKSIRRGFSFGNLQALFVPPAASPSGPSMPALSSPTRTSSSLPQDQEQESAPQTPDMNDFSLPSIPPFIAAAGEQDGGMTARKGGEIDGADAVMDDSFEMHLDSLHFESLSFDADRFDLSP